MQYGNMKPENIRDSMNGGKQTKPYRSPLANARMRNWFFMDNNYGSSIHIRL
jgi:hypothetical protein